MEDLVSKDEIKALVKSVVDTVEEIPEPFKQKTFEILLTILLQRKLESIKPKPSLEMKLPEEVAPQPSKFIIPPAVKAFLNQQNVPEEHLPKLFMVEGTETHPIYRLEETKVATAQIKLALLTALENALKGGKFEFSIETVRQKCKEHRCYDSDHFMTIFDRNSKFFKDLSDKEHVELSLDGKTELAKVITEIVKRTGINSSA